MVDAHVSGACVERHAGSSPVLGTMVGDCGNCRVGGLCLIAILRGRRPLGRVSSSVISCTKSG